MLETLTLPGLLNEAGEPLVLALGAITLVTGHEAADAALVTMHRAHATPITYAAHPGAMLAPMRQTSLVDHFITRASLGEQTIIFTYSEHILGWLRVCIKRGTIAADKVKFHFITGALEGHPKYKVTSPQIDNNGKFSEWPAGFFDMQDMITDILLDDLYL